MILRKTIFVRLFNHFKIPFKILLWIIINVENVELSFNRAVTQVHQAAVLKEQLIIGLVLAKLVSRIISVIDVA